MINRIHRFHGHNSLRFVYQKGHVVRGPMFSVKSTVNTQRQVYRAAVVVSKKVNKSAVIRNRIRRRLYEQVRLLEPTINNSFDIVITVFSDQVATMPSVELAKQIKSQLSESRILSPKSTSVHDKIDSEGER